MAKSDTDVQQSQGCLLAAHSGHSVLVLPFFLSCLFDSAMSRTQENGIPSQIMFSDASEDSS